MTIVTQFSWDDIASAEFGNPARTAWRDAVQEVAERAKAALPEAVNGRIEKAVAIVLAGDVELMADGKAKVASQSNGQTVYHIANGTCDCADFPRAPHGQCKHKIARGIHLRAMALAKQRLRQLDAAPTGQTTPAPHETPTGEAQGWHSNTTPAPPTPLPEAPVSITLKGLIHGHEVMVTLRGTDFPSVKAQVEQASQWLSAQAPAAHSTLQPSQPPVCQWHGAMKESAKAQGTWYCPAKMADGSYCKSRHPEKGR